MAIDKNNLVEPTNKIINDYVNNQDKYIKKIYENRNSNINYEKYINASEILKKLFEKNIFESDIQNIYAKTTLLNEFYSTSIMSVYEVVENIAKIQDFDKRIKQADFTLIDEIAFVKFSNGKKRRFYSFATKYCHLHNSEDFPIFDNIVARMLKAYLGKETGKLFLDSKDNTTKEVYNNFKNALDLFKENFMLKNVSYKDLDRFLWTYGKAIDKPLVKRKKAEKNED